MRLRGFAWLLACIAGVFAVLLTAVSMSEDEHRRSLKVADVEGAWSAAGGERLTVRADGSAELERVRVSEASCGQSIGSAPQTYSGPATWEFDTVPDENPGVRFDFHTPGSGKSCKVYLVVFPEERAGKGFLDSDSDVPYLRSTGRSD